MSLGRTVLERLSRNVTFRRRLPREFGGARLWVAPGASLSFWKPRLVSDLFAFAEEFVRPGSVVWDVGSNVGLLAMSAAQRAGANGSVVAVEADLWLVQLLRRSAQLQAAKAAAVQVIPAAAFRTMGVAKFQIAERARATNHLAVASGGSQTGGVRETVQVVTVTLDWLLQQTGRAPDVLKIDVEGAEAAVLEGAEQVLATARPVVLCEVFAENAMTVTATLHRHGYRLFDWEASPRHEVQSASYNTLAIPAERAPH